MPRLAVLFLALTAFAAEVAFEQDVRPIFEKHCFKCHGPEKQKSSYRLDAKRIALNGGDNHAPNIIPGKAAESPLVRFIAGEDEEMKMPPKGKPLAAAEIAKIRAWIDAGAEWPDSASAKVDDPLDWWSLKPIVRPGKPAGPAHPIDGFVRAKLAEKKLEPSPEADARTLCRRLYFDLIGLPPTPEEMDAFLADPSADAYERLVDRLLASPRYGERWARHWLDVVHYGDTHGFDKDKPRPNAWPYRDYVIRAFNEDKPYARFVEEQIAGDILYPGMRDGIEALGFIAAGPWDFIGHEEIPESKIDGKIARHLDRDDMVANTIGTFSSMTVHCAQCHNHKFDPITQEDYFSLQAVFAALDRADKSYFADPVLTQRFEQLNRRRRELLAQKEALEKQAEGAAGEVLVKLTAQISEASKEAGGNKRGEFGYHSAISPVQDAVKWVQVDLGRSVVIDRILVQPCFDDFNNIGAGFGFPLRFKVEVSDDPEFKTGVVSVIENARGDVPNPGTAPQTFTSSGATGRHVRITALKLAPRKNDYIFALGELQVFDSTGKNAAENGAVTALDSIEAPPRWRRSNLVDSIAPSADRSREVAELGARRTKLLYDALSYEAGKLLVDADSELGRIQEELTHFPKPSVVYAGTIHRGSGNFKGTAADSGKPRPIFLLARGQVTQPDKELGPGSLSALTFAPARFDLDASANESQRRAALAHWITDERNPLTWRSIVNRVWQYHFGRGFVETPNDFGRNGGFPSHPELLDWLAAEFRDGGGSLKRLHKLIVTSETWRQQSVENSKASKVDANNTLLWRQNRRKLEAEAVRDAVLAVSGKLDLTMGGPGWQDFVIERPEHSPHYRYDLANPDDAKTWRRSIYRFVVRSQTQPWMTALDCADPSIRVDRRNESLSPLQALALLNNGFMLSQSQHFTARVQGESSDLDGQVRRAHLLAFGRPASPEDHARLVAYAGTHGLPNLCRVLLNLNEFVFVD
jgi:Protein of unknown function (DUF1553)/Protein of unknown function (DUF1549)/Planctomycete cytochrome C